MKMITIMPEFSGFYAWVKDASDDTCLVGGNIAEDLCGFQFSDYKVSAGLEADFAAWVGWFELGAYGVTPETMDWARFHQQGLALAIRLKAELGDQVRVVYGKPFEDPARVLVASTDVRTEILADGSLEPLTLRRVAPTE